MKPTNWFGRKNAPPLKFDPKPQEEAFSAVYSNFSKCQPKVAGEVISGKAVEYVGIDVHEKFGDSTLNNGRIIRLFVQEDSFYALMCSI